MSLTPGALQLDHHERNWWAGWTWAQSEYGSSGMDSLEGDEGDKFVQGFTAGLAQRIEGLEQSKPAPAVCHAVHIRRDS